MVGADLAITDINGRGTRPDFRDTARSAASSEAEHEHSGEDPESAGQGTDCMEGLHGPQLLAASHTRAASSFS
jgi:hypothetical protein